jgi:hypothetical protein
MMQHLLHQKLDLRKLRLCAIACCRPVLHLIREELHLEALNVALRYAQGEVPHRDLARVSHLLFNFPWDGTDRSDEWIDTPESRLRSAVSYAQWAVCLAALPRRAAGIIQGSTKVLRAIELTGGKVRREARLIADSIRDIIGNPFRPATIDRAWLRHHHGRVKKLAEDIDRSARYEDLPLLADALEEAGCKDESILEHCRAPGPHVPGCWVPELLLNKTDQICQPPDKDRKALQKYLDECLQELRDSFPPPRPVIDPEQAYQKTMLYGLLIVERWPDREQTRHAEFFGQIVGYDPWCSTIALSHAGQNPISVNLGCLHQNTEQISFARAEGEAIVPDYFAFCVDLTRHLATGGMEMATYPQSRDKAVARLRNEPEA